MTRDFNDVAFSVGLQVKRSLVLDLASLNSHDYLNVSVPWFSGYIRRGEKGAHGVTAEDTTQRLPFPQEGICSHPHILT